MLKSSAWGRTIPDKVLWGTKEKRLAGEGVKNDTQLTLWEGGIAVYI